MEKEKNKTFIDRIWDFFSSIKLAIVIFAALSLSSIVGTVIEQNAAPEKNIKLLTKLFGPDAAPSAFRIFDSLGFMDMYHSWWFVAILILFAANLIICSIDRLPKIMKLVNEPIKPLAEDHFKGFGIKREFVLKGNLSSTKEALEREIRTVMTPSKFGWICWLVLALPIFFMELLSAAKMKVRQASEGKETQLYSERGNYTRLGIYITHFSILVILFGAVIGIRFGFKGFLPLAEGETTSVVETRRGEMRPLGFNIRCDKFEVDFYGESDMPKAYKSWLTVIKDGKEITKKIISVNDPLTYEGTTFYQSSYGMIPGGPRNGMFRFRVTPKDGKTEEVTVKLGESFVIPGTKITVRTEDFSPALTFDRATGRPFTYSEQMNNPAVGISLFNGNNRIGGGWIFKRFPDTGRLREGHTIELTDLWGFQYTGLQVRKDPGVWVVYFGCIAMAVGLFIAFFMSHRKIWVSLKEEKSGTRVIIGASANKNRQSFEGKIDNLAASLSKAAEGGK